MKWLLIFLATLSLATACVVEDQPVNGSGGTSGTAGTGATGGTMDPCGGCTGTTPVCDEDTLTCVQCLTNENCDATAPVCDEQNNVCVCNTDTDCNTQELARCNTAQQTCEPCQADSQCDGIEGLPATDNVCDDGTCFDCTPETEAETCDDLVSCNPATNTCTRTVVGSLIECDECVADSECGDGLGPSDAFRCIGLDYQGEPFPDDRTGFCLKSVAGGGSCVNPYRIVLVKPSLSGEPPAEYCGINEGLTTCHAVQALLDDTQCTPVHGDADCPQPAGLCRLLPGAVNRCTYRCDSIVECATPGSTCGQGDTELDDYCGG